MKQFIFLTLVISCSLSCYSQRDNDVIYERISKKYFKEYYDNPKRVTSFDRIVSLADTVHFKLYIPVYRLREISDMLLNYQRINPYIQKELSSDNLITFISKPNGNFCFWVAKVGFDRLLRNSLFSQSIIQYLDDIVLGLSGANPNLAKRNFPLADKKIRYEQLKEYADAHPETTLFMIDELPGIWGYKNDRLIKLVFDRKKVKELDGETYYREYLFPLSPQGIKRVIEGKSFRVLNN